jgi:hypothetical protein
MTRYLVSEENPQGRKLEDILIEIRGEILARCTKLTGDTRQEALDVLANNVAILQNLTESIEIAIDSTTLLDKAFGPSQAEKGGPPRIGTG